MLKFGVSSSLELTLFFCIGRLSCPILFYAREAVFIDEELNRA